MAFGRGKLILLGEHAVVHGRPALACGIERGAHATAVAADAPSLLVEPWGVDVAPDPSSDVELARAFDAALSSYDERPSVRVSVEVDLPGGAGLGCSAAIGVAVLSAIDEAIGATRTPDAIADASIAWERVFHGNPSGVDGAMAACGGVAVFRRGEPLERITPKKALTLVVGHSGEAPSTREMVESVARQLARAPERVEEVFDGIAALVQNGRFAVVAGDHEHLGQLMNLDQTLLNALLLSTARLEELCSVARIAGALGAKLTGGGGGGCMIALVADRDAAAPVVAALEALDASPFVAEVRG